MIVLIIVIAILMFCLLCSGSLAGFYATQGLTLWFTKMIPALLPFMILSGLLFECHLTERFASLFHPILNVLFRTKKQASFCIVFGFLCGFPMGAKVVAMSVKQNLLTRSEGEFLLAFCNNIGPLYFITFVLPCFGIRPSFSYYFGMYGIPLLYGFCLRYTLYRKRISLHSAQIEAPFAMCGEIPASPSKAPLKALYAVIESSLCSIAMLGGYMVLFSTLNLIPHVFLGQEFARLIAPLMEISGGLSALHKSEWLYGLLATSFSGLSCFAQTAYCVADTGLSMRTYVCHKIVLSFLSGIYYVFFL
jgi:hypothetical protein